MKFTAWDMKWGMENEIQIMSSADHAGVMKWRGVGSMYDLRAVIITRDSRPGSLISDTCGTFQTFIRQCRIVIGCNCIRCQNIWIVDICYVFVVRLFIILTMLLQKNSAVYVTKLGELDDTWTRDSAGLWRNGRITWVLTGARENVLSHEHDVRITYISHPGRL